MITDRAALALPIYSALPDLRERLRAESTVILQAPPGSGKSTIVPIELIQEPWLEGKKVVMLEPRRLAARSVAARMAYLLGETVGKRVGYRIRFDSKVSKETKIEVVTEGILTRMLQSDNALAEYGLVIFDEFHERGLAGDLALALVRQSQSILRDDLRVLLMSATMDTASLSKQLGDAPVVQAEGRTYPITLKYVGGNPDPRKIADATTAVVHQALRDERGDMLVFLPGTGEIRRTATALEERVAALGIRLFPLYGDLSPQDQDRAIQPDPEGRRKIVLATSIAETSLTIEGITTVIDCGFSRVSRFDPASGLSRLVTVRVTKDAADQRAGRAGRLGPGVAYRLWEEAATSALLPSRVPEILEADLAALSLDLLGWGVHDPLDLEWITPPAAGSYAQATELLRELDAVDDKGITNKGRRMLRLPTHPRIAHMLIEAEDVRLTALAMDIAAILEERDPLPREGRMSDQPGADFALRIEALRRTRRFAGLQPLERLAQNWSRLLGVRLETSPPSEEDIAKLIAAAYPERIARRISHGKYRLANGRTAILNDHDPLAVSEWLAIANVDAASTRIHLAATLDPKDVEHLARPRDVLEWDEQQGVLIARRERRIGEIILDSKPTTDIPDADRARVLSDAIRREGLRVLNWTESLDQWRARVQSLHLWRRDEWPDVSDDALLTTLEEWLGPHLTSVRKRADFAKLDLSSVLRNTLDWQKQQELNALAPETIEVPSGSNIRLEYFMDGRPPVLAVRLQEVFGLVDTPRINQGRTPVLMHLLSPGYKPVQVTQDLKNFWQTTYHEIRKELRIRYPKHSWPEDPWTAQAIRGALRRR